MAGRSFRTVFVRYKHVGVITVAIVFAAACCVSAAPPDFGRDIRPILSDNCFKCHGPDEKQRQGDLRLDTREGAFRIKDGIAVIVPGKSGESELLRRIISHDPDERMPPPDSQRKLTPQQIEHLKLWIDAGAKWTQHWSFDAPRRTPLPVAESGLARGRNSIDAWVLARLADESLEPSPEADPRTLIRRVTLDLTGLPPTLDEVEAFLKDPLPGAYERLVDRLLASPRFGERMVWDWLDAARYADSNGYQGDGERTMWLWRDWVIDAFNRDLPFDDFTTWQLAGDLLPNATIEQKLATGFCRNHMINGEGGRIPEENRIDYVMDMTETMGTVWLGLTFNCCRCHDHKFDAISQRDYYSLFAFFNQTPIDGGGGNPQTPPVLEMPNAAQSRRRKELQDQINTAAKAIDAQELAQFPRPDGKPVAESEQARDLPDEIKKVLHTSAAQRNGGQLDQLIKHFTDKQSTFVESLRKLVSLRDERDALIRRIPRVMVMEDRLEPRETFMLTTGLYNKPSEKVVAATPHSLPALPADAVKNRLALAKWLVARENPLPARVLVNRLWQQFFGVGFVKTAEDFGVQGESPIHSELLDWLAVEFRDNGWEWKHVCRLIVTSATYRQSSRTNPKLTERDPENRLLARGARFRLPAWMLRDQALSVSRLLVSQVGGEPVRPYQPPGVWEDTTFGNKRYELDRGAALYRRSVYTFWRRIVAPTMFFDSASRQTCTVKTARTNTPLHALTTFNDITFVEAARSMAERVLREGGPTAKERIDFIYQLVLARSPTSQELEVLQGSIARLLQEFAVNSDSAKQLLSVGESQRDESLALSEHAAYTSLCLAVLNLDESLTKE